MYVFSAEVQQVRSSTLLQIGDRNRSYTVKLACIKVEPQNENNALIWMKRRFRTKRKVNLKPQGSDNGMLLAKVIPLDTNEDLAAKLAEKGLGSLIC